MFGIGLQEIVILMVVLGVMVAFPLVLVVGVIAIVRYRDRASQTQNPNLEICSDCGGIVSIHAEACPHCGCVRQTSGE